MNLFKRISDIVSANLGEMAEQFENPEMMLKQAVREMEQSINSATQETARALANEKKLSRELAHNESEARRNQQQAEAAVEAGRDADAREALVRKREHELLAVALRDQRAAAQDASQTLRNQLDGMKAKLAEAKRNLATLTARKKAADVRKNVYTRQLDVSEMGVDDDAFQKFERMRDRVEQAEAEAEALAELRGYDTASSGVPPVSAQDTASVDDELAALKQKSKQ